MERFRSLNWRAALGAVALIALGLTVFLMMIYEVRTPLMRASGTVAIITLVAYLVTGGLQQLKFFRSRQFMRGSASTLYTVAIIGILVLVNILAGQTSWRWDVTAEREHSLSDQTISVLRNLEDDVTITAFFPDGSGIKAEVDSLLREYQYHSPRINVRFIDPERHPGLAREYEVTRAYTTVVEAGGARRTLTGMNLYDFSAYDPQGDPSEILFQGEQAFTRAILYLTGQVSARIYFTAGHGEADLYEEYSVLRGFLTGEGYSVSTWNPGRDGPVPEDADLVVIGGPSRDLQRQETEDLKRFIDAGGRIMMLADTYPGQNYQFVNLTELAAHVGVNLRPDLVIEPMRAYYMDPLVPVPRLDYHDITKKLIDNNMLVAMPRSRSLTVVDDPPEGLEIKRLLFTSNESRTQTEPQDQVEGHQEMTGPLALAYSVARVNPDAESDEDRLTPVAVIFGDADFVGNDIFGFQGNSDLFISAMQWLLDQADLITIRPRRPVPRQVFLTPNDSRMIFYGSTLALPLVVLCVGGVVWLRRRHL